MQFNSGYNNNNYAQNGNNGGGHGRGGHGRGNYHNEIELGARRRTNLGPTLLSPVRNSNAIYTPIQHRRPNNGGGFNGGGFNAGYSGYNSNTNGGYNLNYGGGGTGNTNGGYNPNYGGGGGTGNINGGYNPNYGGGGGNGNGNETRYTDWPGIGSGNGDSPVNTLLGEQDRPDGAAAMSGQGSPDRQMRPRLGSKRSREGMTDNTDGPPRTRSRQ
jgi:hypothetical protein